MYKKIILMASVTGLLISATLAGAENDSSQSGWSRVFGREDRTTKKEAEVLVKKAVAAYSANKVKALSDFTAPSKRFAYKDFYILAYDGTGKCLAHGHNAKQVGNNLIGLKDSDGKAFVKERIELANTKGTFWQYYKYYDPLSKKVLPKEMYCEKADDAIICGGIYKQ